MGKIVTKAGNIKYALSANDTFVAAVEPGETVEVECAININDGVITHLGQQLTPADVTCRSSMARPGRSRSMAPSPATCSPSRSST